MKKILFLFIAPLLFIGCSKDNAEPDYSINETDLVTNFDKEFQFVVKQGSNNIDPSALTWTSSDKVVGTIDTDGLFHANRIGATTITGTNGTYTVKSEVTVASYDEIYKEPILTFGASKADIKAKETKALLEETENVLVYRSESNRLENMGYTFANNMMQSAIAVFKMTNTIGTELGIYMAERYTYIGDNEEVILLSNDRGVLVAIRIDPTLGLIAMYLEETSLQGTTMKASSKKPTLSLKAKLQSVVR